MRFHGNICHHWALTNLFFALLKPLFLSLPMLSYHKRTCTSNSTPHPQKNPKNISTLKMCFPRPLRLFYYYFFNHANPFNLSGQIQLLKTVHACLGLQCLWICSFFGVGVFGGVVLVLFSIFRHVWSLLATIMPPVALACTWQPEKKKKKVFFNHETLKTQTEP